MYLLILLDDVLIIQQNYIKYYIVEMYVGFIFKLQ